MVLTAPEGMISVLFLTSNLEAPPPIAPHDQIKTPGDQASAHSDQRESL